MRIIHTLLDPARVARAHRILNLLDDGAVNASALAFGVEIIKLLLIGGDGLGQEFGAAKGG